MPLCSWLTIVVLHKELKPDEAAEEHEDEDVADVEDHVPAIASGKGQQRVRFVSIAEGQSEEALGEYQREGVADVEDHVPAGREGQQRVRFLPAAEGQPEAVACPHCHCYVTSYAVSQPTFRRKAYKLHQVKPVLTLTIGR